MLRITTEAEAHKVTLKLEGELTGIWVSELFDSWREALCSRDAVSTPGGSRVLCIDLSGVGRVDKAGEYLLALMRCTCSTQLTGSGMITRELVSSIARDWPLANPNAVEEA